MNAMKRRSSSSCPCFRELAVVGASIHNGCELHLGANYSFVAYNPCVKRKSGIMYLVIQFGW